MTDVSKEQVGRFLPFLQATKALRVSRGIALLFLGLRHTRRGGGQPHTPAAFTPGKNPLPIVQETGWVPGPSERAENLIPNRLRSPDRRGRSKSLYKLSYPDPKVNVNKS